MAPCSGILLPHPRPFPFPLCSPPLDRDRSVPLSPTPHPPPNPAKSGQNLARSKKGSFRSALSRVAERSQISWPYTTTAPGI
ncbi:hypothetical protein PVAP13_9NG227446 [Panicum virgatum]|uniref:Uncharacterized protein n=1 Tax=Panicum virgatum TaxID=38727 RepID=A0A8T0MIB9_PANVG|nr:hypothetical protein PVAP13_9NG227446 [Panicum virgatum]